MFVYLADSIVQIESAFFIESDTAAVNMQTDRPREIAGDFQRGPFNHTLPTDGPMLTGLQFGGYDKYGPYSGRLWKSQSLITGRSAHAEVSRFFAREDRHETHWTDRVDLAVAVC